MATSPAGRPLLPLACTLGAEDGAQRLDDWRAVVRDFGTGTQRETGAIIVTFRDGQDVGATLERLVTAERDCCAFLGWERLRTEDAWTVRITGTDEELATVSLGEMPSGAES